MDKFALLATGVAIGYLLYQQYGEHVNSSTSTCPDCNCAKCPDCPKCPDCEQRPCQKCANVDYDRIKSMIDAIERVDTPSVDIDYNRLQGMFDNLEFPQQEGIDYDKIKNAIDQSISKLPTQIQEIVDSKPVTDVDYERMNNMFEQWREDLPGIDYDKIPTTTVDYNRIQKIVDAVPRPDIPDGVDYDRIQTIVDRKPATPGVDYKRMKQLISQGPVAEFDYARMEDIVSKGPVAQFDYSKLPKATDYRRLQKMIDAKKVTPGVDYDRLAGMLPSIDYDQFEQIVQRNISSEKVTYDPSGQPMVFLYPERNFKGPRTVLRIGSGSVKVHSAISGKGFVVIDGVRQANDVFHFQSAIVKNFKSNPNYRLVVIEQPNNGQQSCHTQFGDGEYKVINSLLSSFGSIGTFATNVTHYLDIMSCAEFQRSQCRAGQGFACV